MGRRACFLCALSLAACAADPSFEPSDASDTTAIDSTTDDSASASDETGETGETGDTGETGETGDAAPGCGEGCGPLASCVEERCTCDDVDCNSVVATPFVPALAAGLDGSDHIMLVFARWDPQGLDVARTGSDGFVVEQTVSPWSGDAALSIASDSAGEPHVVHRTPEQTIAIARPGTEKWDDFDTGFGPCTTAQLALDRADEVLRVGCFDRLGGRFVLSTFDPDFAELVPDEDPALVIDDGVDTVVWALAPDGTPWVAWLDPDEVTGQRVVWLAYRVLGAWTPENVGTFEARALALAVDKAGHPHVFFSHVQDSAVVVSHAAYSDGIHIGLSEVDRKVTTEPFGQRLAAAPRPEGGVALVYAADRRLAYVEITDTSTSAPSVLQTSTSTTSLWLVVSRTGRPEAAFIDNESAHVWLPLGP